MLRTISYDTMADVIVVSGVGEFFPRTLISTITPDGMVRLTTLSGRCELYCHWSDILDGDNNPMIDPTSTERYLSWVVSQSPSTAVSITAVAFEVIAQGMPVAISRADGRARIARADTYPLSFVVGLATDDVEPGMSVSAVRVDLSLGDWSGVTGSPDLLGGQPYFLSPSGGLTTSPDRTPGRSLVRVGNAASTRMLLFTPSDPILL